MNEDNGSVAKRRGLTTHAPWILLVLLATLLSSGCSLVQGVRNYFVYNDTCDEFVLGWRNHVWSSQAWRARNYMFAGQPQFYSFGEGFRAGYSDVASGGTGCPPAIPPREYWSYRYQTPEGQAKLAAWFAGFPHGAEAAREDGAAGFRPIAVSGVTDSMYSSNYQNGQCPTCRQVHGQVPQQGTSESSEVQPPQQIQGPELQPPPN